MKTTVQNVLKLVLPFVLMAGAYYFYKETSTLAQAQLDIIELSPYVIFAVGAVISWKFNRSRELFILVVLALVLASMEYLPGMTKLSFPIAANDIYRIISLLIPLNIGLFSLFRERGILSLWGVLRIGIILSQGLISVWLLRPEQGGLLSLIKKDVLPVSLTSITAVTQLSIAIFLIALILLIIRQVKYKSSQDISFIAVLCALFYVLHENRDPMMYAVFFAVSGIVLITSIIQDSYSMAFTDELTGLPSRRALKQDMMKLGMNYVIAMLDIDHFKKFNDTYGHDTGDEALKLVASVIKDVTGGGKSYRYGGEEFTILFPGKSVQDALPHLEQLREQIAKRPFTLRNRKGKGKSKSRRKARNNRVGKQIYITVSIGLAQKSEKHKKPDAVMKSADMALYRAKKKGRNCVSK
ncbi:GGDEF domain-containing protein [Paenibacillus bouchesdurhonensis]|uniref:GGDEF domain-containing protein n=1 Tax=Paenibacillus bouchesdurhonensis TaxID=1870990 RepID=UPI000DA61AA3|nr:GGDEF domain-containing protein [Paenibacillus bouchesdurhonensis]